MIDWKEDVSGLTIDLQGLHRHEMAWGEKSKTVNLYGYDIKLPEEPADEHCINYGLPIEDQVFRHTYIPPQVLNPGAWHEDAWTEEQLEHFIDTEYFRRKNGVWIFIDGEKVWIPGPFYIFLNYWKLLSQVDIVFRFDALELWYIWIDTLRDPNWDGLIDFKCRQIGDTEFVIFMIWEYSTRSNGVKCPMQSCLGDEHVAKSYNRLVYGNKEMIWFMKPINQGSESPAEGLNFAYPTEIITTRKIKEQQAKSGTNIHSKELYEYPELGSAILFGPYKERYFDGGTYGRAYIDEFGKCFSALTKILMHDGSYKFAKNISVGDKLMGDDSKPRTVSETHRGHSKMYRIKPKANGWETWECNENHILTMKWGRGSKYCKWKKDEIVEMTVKEFLNQPKWVKIHMTLFKVAVEYTKKEVKIDPYLLGLWIGDGGKNDGRFTSIDKEVRDSLEDYCNDNNLKFVSYDYKSCSISRKKGTPQANYFVQSLKHYNLFNNKHIPLDYLFNERSVRLKLLAGLLDTDGYLMQNKNGYEFCQKNKKTAFQVQKLALELGFKSNIAPKIATMRREDGTIYKCKVYRISIFGKNLHEIPCKIARKIIYKKENIHLNTRDSLKTCFTVEQIEDGEFYGFEVDGNHRFLLRDCQVVHNSELFDPAKLLRVYQPAINHRLTGRQVGKIIMTSTVEEMKSGKSLKWAWKLWDQAKPIMKPTGMTSLNKMRRIFRSALDRAPVNRFGKPKREEEKKWIVEKSKEYLENGDMMGKLEHERSNPLTIQQVFSSANDESQFDIDKLAKRQHYLHSDEYENPRKGNKNIKPWVRGNLRWKDDNKESGEAVWEPNSKGRWLISQHPKDFGFKENNRIEGVYRAKPANAHAFRCGIDPYEQKKLVSDDWSLGGICVKRVLDPLIDGKEDRYYKFTDESRGIQAGDPVDGGLHFITNRICCTYLYRHPDPEDFYEDCILTCLYYGTEFLPEKNKANGLLKHFDDRKYDLYKMDGVQLTKNVKGKSEEGGVTATEKTIDEYFTHLMTLSCKWANTIDHPDVLEQMLTMNWNNRTLKDLGVAVGWCEYACKVPIHYRKKTEEQKSSTYYYEQEV